MTRLVLLVAALAACGHGAKPAPIGNGSSSGTPAAGALVLTAGAFGPLHADTPITAENLAKLFPDLVVSADDYDREDGTHTTFTVARGADVLFRIEHSAGALANVQIYSPDIHTDTGLAPGQAFAAASAAFGDDLTCTGMTEEEGGNAMCHGAGAIAFILPMADDGQPQPYDQDIPPDRLPALLGAAKVDSVMWFPPTDPAD